MKLIIVTFILYLFSFSSQQGFYDFELESIEGNNFSLNELRGKKALIILLPVTSSYNSNLFLKELDSISKQNQAGRFVIAVPSIEEGYSDVQKQALSDYYHQHLGTNILVTKGYYTHRSSGSQQNSLLQWLTDKDKNGHFHNDVVGIGQKFFIDENGELYAVYGPEVPLNSRAVRNIY